MVLVHRKSVINTHRTVSAFHFPVLGPYVVADNLIGEISQAKELQRNRNRE